MSENEVARAIVDCAFIVHRALGPGLLESVYETALAHELRKRGFEVKTQVGMTVQYDGIVFDHGFRADLLVNDLVIVEIKSIEALAPVHHKILLTYLKLTGKRLGLLINFREQLVKDGITRIVNQL